MMSVEADIAYHASYSNLRLPDGPFDAERIARACMFVATIERVIDDFLTDDEQRRMVYGALLAAGYVSDAQIELSSRD